jgi:predicted ester cyclase
MSRRFLTLPTLVLAACGGLPVEPEDTTAAQVTDQIQTAASRCTKEEIDNRALLNSYHVTIWEEGRWDLIGNYLAPDFVSHAAPVLPGGQTPGADFMQRFLSAFYPLTSHADSIMSAGDRVSIQWTITARHTGDFFGIPPTNRTIVFSGMDALRVRDGKFVEHWGGIADQMDEVAAKLTSP